MKLRRKNKLLIVITAVLLVCTAAIGIFSPKVIFGGEWKKYPEGDGFSFREERVMEIDISIEPSELEDMVRNSEKKQLHKARATIDGFDFGYIGIRTRGSGSLEYYTVRESGCFPFELRLDCYTKDAAYNGIKRINLNNHDTGYSKYYFLNTILATKMYETLNVPVSDCCYAFVTLNGVDFGLYFAWEEIDSRFLSKHYDNSSGALYKYCDDNGDYYSDMLGNVKTKIATVKGDRLCSALFDDNNLPQGLHKYLNKDETLRYLAASVAMMNDDCLTKYAKNFYLYDNGGRFDVIPWDFDSTFLITDGLKGVGDLTYSHGHIFIKTMLDNDENRQIFLNYVREVTQKCLSPDVVVPFLDKMTQLVDPYLKRDRTCTMLYDIWREAADKKEGFYTLLAEQYRQITEQLDGTLDGFENSPEIAKIIEYEQAVCPRRERPNADAALKQALASYDESDSAQDEKYVGILPAFILFACVLLSAVLLRGTFKNRKLKNIF